MKMADIIDGKSIAAIIREEVSSEVQSLKKSDKIPGLAVILVGNDPASEVYVSMKGKACDKVGIHSITDRPPAEISEAQLLEKIDHYNNEFRLEFDSS